VMKQGIIQRIGMGESTHAWNHNWLPCDHVLRPLVCKVENPPEMVSAFINTDSMTWNKGALEQCFLPMDVDCICKIPLSTSKQQDSWSWHAL
jgi:hypothetical protein